MHVNTKIQKWGNGLGLRVSGVLRDLPQFQEGATVDIEVTQEGFTVKKKTAQTSTLRYTEAELLKGLCAKTAHAELLTAPLTSESYD